MASSEIGNKGLIRAIGEALSIIDVRQFPGRLNTDPIQMVLPLNLIPYKLVTRTGNLILAVNDYTRPVFSTDPGDSDPAPIYENRNELRLVGGIGVAFEFAVAPVSGDRVSLTFQMSDWQSGGNNIPWTKHFDTVGFALDNDRLFYSFGIDSPGMNGSSDRRTGTMQMPLLGWIPANCRLQVTMQLWDNVTSAQKAWPAMVGSPIVSFLAVESPLGIIPPV